MTKIDMRDAFFERLVEAARLDERVIVLSADHGAFALKKFEEEMPSRYINMGIAEQNMVGVAAGLAASGKIVFIYGISPFVSLRVLEQLTIDVAAMQLPVNVISVGAGFTYSTDGPTHQGLQDVSAVATIPGMTILNSSDPQNTQAFVELAIQSRKPHYIRIEKEKLQSFEQIHRNVPDFNRGFSVLKRTSSDVVFLSTGQQSHCSLSAADELENKHGIPSTVIDVYRLKVFPSEGLLPFLLNSKWCFATSELFESFFRNEITGLLSQTSSRINFRNFAVSEEFQFMGDGRDKLLKKSELDSDSIVKRALEFLG
jgi:transketolase